MKKIMLIAVSLLLLMGSAAAASVQLQVFGNGNLVFSTTVDVPDGSTAHDVLLASGAPYEYTDWGSWGIFVDSIAGVGGYPAFFVNGASCGSGVSDYVVSSGDKLTFIGPNDVNTAGILYIKTYPNIVGKGEKFRVCVWEKPAYDYLMGGLWPNRPSSGATVTVGGEKYTTGSDGCTEEISFDLDAYYCVYAEKPGYVASPYLGGLPLIQVGIGGDVICDWAGGGLIPDYDEQSSITGTGFTRCYNRFVTPTRETKFAQGGSGVYNTDKVVNYGAAGIDFNESADLTHAETSFKVYRNRDVSYRSKYEDQIRNKNYGEGALFNERYYYLDYINKDSAYNNSGYINYSLESDFQGSAEFKAQTVSYQEVALHRKNASDREEKMEILQGYSGSFKVMMKGRVPLTGAYKPVNDTSEESSDDDCNETTSYLSCCLEGIDDPSILEGEYWNPGISECIIDEETIAVQVLAPTSDEDLVPTCTGKSYLPCDDSRIELAADYLLSCQNDDGGFGPKPDAESNIHSTATAITALASLGDDSQNRAVNGKTALDYLVENTDQLSSSSNIEAHTGRYVVAMVAAGADPHDISGTNYVEVLKSYCKPSGAIGNENYIWDDAWVILGLAASGEYDSTEVSKAADYLTSLQADSGGWSWNGAAGGLDADTTGIVICALAAAGEDAGSESVQKALNYFKSEQNQDAGFSSLGSNSASTGWVIMALNAINQDPIKWQEGSNNPIDYLLSLQKEDGSIWWKDNSEGTSFEWTAHGIVSLTGGEIPPTIFQG